MSDIQDGATTNQPATEPGDQDSADGLQAREQVLPADPRVSALLEGYKDKIEQAKKDKFIFLLIGRVGVGKSSSVNSLMGKEVAPVGHWEPTTMSVESYDNEVFGIKFTVIDTPGLCDDIREAGRDYTYLKRIQEGVAEFDCLWFVTPLYDTRVTNDEKSAIRLIGKAFGKEVWQNAIIVFTFANSPHPQVSYEEACKQRARLIRQEIAQASAPEVAEKVPSVAIDNYSKTTPDGNKWLGELYITVFTRIGDSGFLPFLMATAPRLVPDDPATNPVNANSGSSYYAVGSTSGGESYIHLDERQREIVKSTTESFFERGGLGMVAVGASTGAGIGAIVGGPVGAAVGAVVGGAVGAVLGWLFS